MLSSVYVNIDRIYTCMIGSTAHGATIFANRSSESLENVNIGYTSRRNGGLIFVKENLAKFIFGGTRRHQSI